jgi:site-specific DNA recombinase
MAVKKTKKELITINGKKRVGCFYRVSSKGQLDGDDIPSQRRSCLAFIEAKGWEFAKEYVEKGVSGYKVSASDRDSIQEAKRDAESGEFDILLCFMYDRLGRRDDETPFVVEWFAKRVEVWSVMEGQQKFDNHTDNLTNYIRFWQAGGESKKTSMRVSENHVQMVEDGKFRGGKPPYGYKLVKSGAVNKKGKDLTKLAIDEEQSKVIRIIYDFVYSLGYGSNRIVKYLNSPEVNIPSSTGGKWNTGVINFILRNPIYKGYMVYGKRKSEDGQFKMASQEEWILSKEQIAELVIIDEQIWDKVQMTRSSRSPENIADPDIERFNVTKSPLLFVGMIKCGHCGSPLTTTYNSKTHTLADGTIQKYTHAKYRCSGKALGKTNCTGQTIYSQNKIEGFVMKELNNYLDQLKDVDVSEQLKKIKKSSASEEELEYKRLSKQAASLKKEHKTLTDEVTKSIMGKSSFKPELLNSLIEGKESEVNAVETQLIKLEQKLKSKRLETSEMENLIKSIPVWKEVFAGAEHEKKKMMLNGIIDGIIVRRDSIELNVKIKINDLIKSFDGQYNKLTRSPS